MNISYDYPLVVYKKIFSDNVSYSIGLNKKNKDGTYSKGFIPIQFKKDIELNDRDKIFIKNAFLTFYLNKEGKAVFYVMCMDYEEAKFDKIENKTDGELIQQAVNIPDNEIKITDDDLPF